MAETVIANRNAGMPPKRADVEIRYGDPSSRAVSDLVSRTYLRGLEEESLFNHINSIKSSLETIKKSVSDQQNAGADLMMIAAVCICRINKPEIADRVATTMASIVSGKAPDDRKRNTLIESTAIITRFVYNNEAIQGAMERFRSYVCESASNGDETIHHKLTAIQGLTGENYAAFLKAAAAVSCDQVNPLKTADTLNRIAKETRNSQTVIKYAQMLMIPRFSVRPLEEALRNVS